MFTTRAPRVVIIGAGPIGLEAALVARLSGMDVSVLDAKSVGGNVRDWGFVQMFTPWSLNTTQQGRSASADAPILASEDCPTGAEFVEKYLAPLASSPLLRDCVEVGARVLAVGGGAMPENQASSEGGVAPRFSILVCDRFGVDQVDHADFVLDCSGNYGNCPGTGNGGIPAIGERALKNVIWHTVPDLLGKDRVRFADRRVLLVGTGTSAAMTLMALAQLVETAPQTRVTWIYAKWGKLLQNLDEDPLRPRRQLFEKALRLTVSPPPWLTIVEDGQIERYSPAHSVTVDIRQRNRLVQCHADEVIAAVGFTADESIFASLPGRPQYNNALQTHNAIERENLELTRREELPVAATELVSVVPGYYILGAKSYGLNASFLLRVGHCQVRDVFETSHG